MEFSKDILIEYFQWENDCYSSVTEKRKIIDINVIQKYYEVKFDTHHLYNSFGGSVEILEDYFYIKIQDPKIKQFIINKRKNKWIKSS